MKSYRKIRKTIFANSSIDKIICRDCKFPNARFMNSSKRGIFTVDENGRVIFSIDPLIKEGSELSKLNDIYIENNYPQKHFLIKIHKLNLSSGNYYISITMRCADTNLILSWHHLELKLKIVGGFTGDAPILYSGEWEIERKNSSSF